VLGMDIFIIIQWMAIITTDEMICDSVRPGESVQISW